MISFNNNNNKKNPETQYDFITESFHMLRHFKLESTKRTPRKEKKMVLFEMQAS